MISAYLLLLYLASDVGTLLTPSPGQRTGLRAPLTLKVLFFLFSFFSLPFLPPPRVNRGVQDPTTG